MTRLLLCLVAMMTGMSAANAAVPGRNAPVAQGATQAPGLAVVTADTGSYVHHAIHADYCLSDVLDSGASSRAFRFVGDRLAGFTAVHRADRTRE